MNEDEQVFKRGASPPLQPIKYPFRLPVQYQSNLNWRNTSSSEESTDGQEIRSSKRKHRKKSKKKSKKRYEGELQLVPAATGNFSASPSPSPPPPPQKKDKKLCPDFDANGRCDKVDCYFMHSEFPCKFFYLNLECPDGSKCRQSHAREFLSNEMKHGLLNYIFKSRPEVLGEQFFNFKKTNSIQEIITMLEKRLSDFPKPVTPSFAVFVKSEPLVSKAVSFFFLFDCKCVIFFYY